MLLIASAAYLNPEFTAEFGQLPPAFLPVGNRRLYEWQLDQFEGRHERTSLSIPEDYELPLQDEARLHAAGVTVIRVPVGLTLGASIVYCANVSRLHQERFAILFGDTLLRSIDLDAADIAVSSSTTEYYAWAECELDVDGAPHFTDSLPSEHQPRRVLAGYFCFSDPSLLINCITRSGYTFIAGLQRYSDEQPLTIVQTDDWLDFGHIQLYFQSKARMTTERVFNQLIVADGYVQKSSSDHAKINAEAGWFEALPPAVLPYTPRYLGRVSNLPAPAYRTQYVHLSTLSELWVFGTLPSFVWGRMISRCLEFLRLAQTFRAPASQAPTLAADYRSNLERRLQTFASAAGVPIDTATTYDGKPLPSLASIADNCLSAIGDATVEDMTLWHGDFCFSNVFFDFRSQSIQMVDPRGRDFAGQPSLYGDRRYDIAKLLHSAVGGYDHIIARRYYLQRDGDLSFTLGLPQSEAATDVRRRLSEAFGDGRRIAPDVSAMTVMLFLSMLPLHDDNPGRQTALLANALRLYRELDEHGGI